MDQSKLSAERARELFSYDPATGLLTWKVGRGRARVGEVAGTPKRAGGRLQVQVDGRLYGAHRIVWLLVYGVWPSGAVDHVNGDDSGNRVGNLRDVTQQKNSENQRHPHGDSQTGVLGVSKCGSRFRSQLGVRGRQKYLGTFATPEEAHQAYLTAKRQLHAGCTI